jgi:hypothetical protein
MKNLSAPRTLAECQFAVGHPTATPTRPEAAAGVVLATVIGALLAIALVAWWSA